MTQYIKIIDQLVRKAWTADSREEFSKKNCENITFLYNDVSSPLQKIISKCSSNHVGICDVKKYHKPKYSNDFSSQFNWRQIYFGEVLFWDYFKASTTNWIISSVTIGKKVILVLEVRYSFKNI